MRQHKNNYGAIIPAAGLSSRMGRFKPFLPLGDSTILESQINLVKSAGILSPVVVAGFHAGELRPAAEKLGAIVVNNNRYKEGMFTSVAAGVNSIDEELSAFFVLPADIPLVTGITMLRLCRSFEQTGASIIYPVFEGRRGHPPLISTKFIPEIMKHDGKGGLRTVLERHEDEAEEFETSDSGILYDMDTPEGYELVLSRWAQRQIPSEDDCFKLLEDYKTPEAVKLHSKKTAELAADICSQLNSHGCNLSVTLAERAGLLHDLAKGQPDHAAEGSRLLSLHGYNDIARICGQHMNLDYRPGMRLTEAEVVYLSDKLLEGSVVQTLSQRCAQSLKRKGKSPEIRQAIEDRFASAGRIADEINKILGYNLFTRLITPIQGC